MMVRRLGLKEIQVNETVELELSYWNINNYGKKQFSGWIKGEYWYLPTHQQLVKQLSDIPRESLVRVKRLTKGGPKEACRYDVKVLRQGPEPQEQRTLDSY